MERQLTDKVTLRHGAVLNDRMVMAPMVTLSGTANGEVTQEQVDYYGRRSQVAGMIIVEATYIHPNGHTFKGHLGMSNDHYIPGMKKLAAVIKKNGAKAILQLHHGGREAATYYDHGGIPLAPSDLDYQHNAHSSIDYPVQEMTLEQIHNIVKEYGAATKRAIQAGFDGIEIHGANHYLLQQFFSALTNHRTDEYGGNLANRMRLDLEIVDEVVRVVHEYGSKEFIIGIRISPNEIHGDRVGFDFKENQELIKQLNTKDIDYVHISGLTANSLSFRNYPAGQKETYTQLYKDVLSPDIKLITCGSVFSVDDAKEAAEQADLVGIAREALIEPDYAKKLHAGKASEIVTTIDPTTFDLLMFPETLKGIFTTDIDKDDNGKEKHGYFAGSPLPNIEAVRK
ncbi:NADH-dependent oxidoreductase [Limosilactobacillus sp. STM2_1]|uniref:NADH-dependent oxidoreductase n=1 Tax=Limosilactobacillus rudii TaxID=2759755 RepID=A0A7W3UM83_9LACO|nr:NADH-dependent oxidoreductase [Limosilactobacillus rudii]MBB1079569.1 NADH-dependent oxidoreductase [Limosilactobacillus rudii]MBB1097615.1 NADH-dependent oxidoreductase [Limosilactobacillus rudii]MCD7134724.1 NADH-dependent oxidoreductase [Limosilactobacillus rudii]